MLITMLHTRTKIRAYANFIESIVFGGEQFECSMRLCRISILNDYLFFARSIYGPIIRHCPNKLLFVARWLS